MNLELRPAFNRLLAEVKPNRSTLKEDAVAGLPGAISSVPDGMAASVLAGVNPVYGLYASGFGPIAGGLTSNTRLMVITTTSAAALAAGSTLSGVEAADRPAALFLLTILAGVAMIAAGAVQARALHAVRLALGDDRVPHRDRRQHHPRADPRPARCGRGGLDQRGQGVRRPDDDRRRRSSHVLHRAVGVRHRRRPRSDADPVDQRGGRPGRSDDRDDHRRARQRRRVEDVGEIPTRTAVAAVPGLRIAVRRDRGRRPGDRRDRAGPRRRCRAVGAEHRRRNPGRQPGLHRPRRRQRRCRGVPGPTRRRICRSDRSQRDGRRRGLAGRPSSAASGCSSSCCSCRSSSARWRCRRWLRCSSTPLTARCASPRCSRSCASTGSPRSR